MLMDKRVKVIVFNGPPSAGKDTAVGVAREMLGNKRCGHVMVKAPLIRALTNALLIPWAKILERKEEPLLSCSETTGRQALISCSEDWLKKCFGKEILGMLAADRIQQLYTSIANAYEYIFVSDCGFQYELDTMSKCLGSARINLVVYSIRREGYDFSSDSREYVGGSRYVTDMRYLSNDGSLEEFETQIHLEALTWEAMQD